MKKILLILSLLSSPAYSWNFHFLGSILSSTKYGIKDFGTYKAFSNGYIAKSCNDYRNPSNNLMLIVI